MYIFVRYGSVNCFTHVICYTVLTDLSVCLKWKARNYLHCLNVNSKISDLLIHLKTAFYLFYDRISGRWSKGSALDWFNSSLSNRVKKSIVDQLSALLSHSLTPSLSHSLWLRLSRDGILSYLFLGGTNA